ncbi:MAG: MEDS domain-containing protein [Bacillota bacterium]
MKKIVSDFEELQPHDHLCLLYREHEEWKAAITSFLQTGLVENDKCLYISGAYTAQDVKKYLKEVGIDVEKKVNSKQLVFLDKEDSYAQKQEFVPQEMIDFLKQAATQASEEGYNSLRVTGEISWALDYVQGEEKIIEYELGLNEELFSNYSISALCRYHLDKFDPGLIKNVIKTHPYIVVNNKIHENPYYISPDKFSSEPEEVEQWLENINDFTKLKGRFKNTIQKSREKLEIKNKELEQLLYIISHDLRSPLVNIQGFSKEISNSFTEVKKILAEKDSAQDELLGFYLEEDIPESLSYILKSTNKIDSLLEGLLNLSRSTRNKLQPKKLDINQIVDEIISNFEYKIQEEEVEIKVGDLPVCYGDKEQINRVFSNLLENAIKYLDNDKAAKIKVTGYSEEERVVYSVEDNGIGIAKKDQEKIFTIFSRLDYKDNVQGEGLGLTIIKKIIDLHQGQIWLESELGVGSKFFFALPSETNDRID